MIFPYPPAQARSWTLAAASRCERKWAHRARRFLEMQRTRATWSSWGVRTSRVSGVRLGVLIFCVGFYGFFAGWYVITQVGELF